MAGLGLWQPPAGAAVVDGTPADDLADGVPAAGADAAALPLVEPVDAAFSMEVVGVPVALPAAAAHSGFAVLDCDKVCGAGVGWGCCVALVVSVWGRVGLVGVL